MQRPKLCIFDMDGLLIDSEPQPLEAHRLAAEEFNIPLTREQYLTLIGRNVQGSDRQLLSFFPELDVNRYRARMNAIKTAINERDGIPLKPGVEAMLDYLEAEGIERVVATSTARTRAEQILSEHGILHRFAGLACGDEVRHSKPHPEIFLKALAITGAEANHALVFEDSYQGLQAATRAGIPAIMIPDLLPPSPHYPATHTVADLHEAIDYLKELGRASEN